MRCATTAPIALSAESVGLVHRRAKGHDLWKVAHRHGEIIAVLGDFRPINPGHFDRLHLALTGCLNRFLPFAKPNYRTALDERISLLYAFTMIKTFEDKRTEALHDGRVPKGVPADVAKRAVARLFLIAQ